MSPNNFTVVTQNSRKRSIKTVHFSPKVSLRCFTPSINPIHINRNQQQQQNQEHPQQQRSFPSSYSSWLSVKQVRDMKTRAKILAKHFRLREERRRLKGEVNKLASCHPSQYEIIGESLRGMEYMTDVETGRERQNIKTQAFDAVQIMQKEVTNVGSASSLMGDWSSSSSCARSAIYKVNAMRRRVATAYEESSREALMFSKRVAEEDAKVAAVILAEDLSSSGAINAAPAPRFPTTVPTAPLSSSSCESDCGSPTSVKDIFSLNNVVPPKAGSCHCGRQSSVFPVTLSQTVSAQTQTHVQRGVPTDLQLLVAVALNSRGINARSA